MEEKKYELGQVLSRAEDYKSLLKEIIHTCDNDFALVAFDQVTVPLDIRRRAKQAIGNADDEFGSDNWAILGNFGVEFITEKTLKYLFDVEGKILPSPSVRPRPVIFLDANTILLNIKNLKHKNISVPAGVINPDLSVTSLLAESYKKGLICAVDSNLYVSSKLFQKKPMGESLAVGRGFIEYWKNNFVNHKFATLDGIHDIENSYEYLRRSANDKRKDFYGMIASAVLEKYHSRGIKKKLFIVVRSQLGRLNYLQRSLDMIRIANLKYKAVIDLGVVLALNNIKKGVNCEEELEKLKKEYSDIDLIFSKEKKTGEKLFPRVSSIKNAVEEMGEDSFVWIVDDDDFIFPSVLQFFPFLLDSRFMLLGNADVFEEKWNDKKESFPVSSKKIKTFFTSDYAASLNGHNVVPVNTAIYPAKALKAVFRKHDLFGDYAEDYAIFLLAQQKVEAVYHLPVSIAGISYHEKNTIFEADRTHWTYSYTTFRSELVNSGIVNDLAQNYFQYFEKKGGAVGSLSLDKAGKIEKIRTISKNLYRGCVGDVLVKARKTLRKKGFKRTLRYLWMYALHGRKIFRDGVDSLDDEGY